jgi:hypothetical protein
MGARRCKNSTHLYTHIYTYKSTHHGRAQEAAEDPLVEDARGADAGQREAEEGDDDADGRGAAQGGVDIEAVLFVQISVLGLCLGCVWSGPNLDLNNRTMTAYHIYLYI